MDKQIQAFWHSTWLNWRSGLLLDFMPGTKTCASCSFEEFLTTGDVHHPAMSTFFSLSSPQVKEFLIGYDGNAEDKPVFVLTNQRLLIYQKKEKTYATLLLDQIVDFTCKGTWTYTLDFQMVNGENMEFRGLGSVPKDELFKFVLEKACSRAWPVLNEDLPADVSVHEINVKETSAQPAPAREPPASKTDPSLSPLPYGFIFAAAVAVFLFANKEKLGQEGGFIYIIAAIVLGFLSANLMKGK